MDFAAQVDGLREQLRQIQQFRLFFESAPGLYLVLTPDFFIAGVSDAYLRATMTERNTIIGKHLFEVFPDNPDDHAATGTANLRRSLQRVLLHKIPDVMAVQKYDVQRPEAAGGEFEERFWSPLNSPVLGPGGEVVYIIHKVEDVTEYVRVHHETTVLKDRVAGMEAEVIQRAQQLQEANRALEKANAELARSSEERYRQLFEANPHPMWVLDTATRKFAAVNTAALEKYGYLRGEFLSLTMADIEETSPSRHRKKDGTIIEVEMASHELPLEGGSARLISAIDVTEKRKIEAQLLRTQRMESIGTLAGGIAHDLNNILAPIMMGLQLLKVRFDDPASARLLDTLESSAKRGANIVRQVLTFARGAQGEMVPIQLRHLLSALEPMLRQTFPKSMDVQLVLPRDLWTVIGDPTQIDQVLLNVCVNSRDAMPRGGRLTISACNTNLDEHYARLNIQASAGPYVMVEIADTGVGIPPEVQEKMFEPFFTTKPIGQSTGLGLSMVQAIVKSHGGFVNVYSEVGKGTIVKVYFPATESESTREAVLQQSELPHGKGELILVVDDEQAVREIAQVTLESYNYQVISARNGAVALGMYAQRQHEIRAVLLDMMMPIMDGPATIRALQTINPTVIIIAASGLVEGARQPVHAVLSKPYTAEKLLTTLASALHG